MKSIAFLGNGKLANQIQNFLNKKTKIFDKEGEYEFSSYKDNYEKYNWILGFGYLHMEKRVTITEEIINNNGNFYTYIHPTSYTSPTSNIKEGVIIYPMCNIDNNTIINPSTLINNSVTICHNTIIGTGTYISPGVIISGDVKIGKGCFIGSGVKISNGVQIGDYSVIGIGSVVTKDIPSYTNCIGNPLKVLDKKITLL